MLSKNRKGFNPFGIEVGKVSESDEDKAFWRTIDTSSLPREKSPNHDLKRRYHTILEEAAVAAAYKVKWRAARQRERAIKVWVGYPVRYVLKENERTTLR